MLSHRLSCPCLENFRDFASFLNRAKNAQKLVLHASFVESLNTIQNNLLVENRVFETKLMIGPEYRKNQML